MQPDIRRQNLAFIDWGNWDYDVTYPLHHPMGGSESALCYLAAALAARGHAVTVINGKKTPAICGQVNLIPNTSLRQDYFRQGEFDAVIVIKGPADGLALKPLLPARTKLFLWTGHAADQGAVAGLRQPHIQAQWDGVIAVSQWQRQSFIAQFGLAPSFVHVLRNAISPAFENLFSDREDLRAAKAQSIRLAYTSTPFRGLDLLIDVFPRLADPEIQLDIYSGMQVYGVAESADPFAALYRAAQALPNVHCSGPIDQATLAKALRGVSILSYPNTFAETSCIAIMEAMAAGAYVLTSDLGALAETTAGFGHLISMENVPRDAYVQSYLDALQQAIHRIRHAGGAFIERQFEQVAYANRQFTWAERAREWEAFLTGGHYETRFA